MPTNEIIGFVIGALIIGGLIWMLNRPRSQPKPHWLDPSWSGGPLESSLRAYREDQLRGDHHLPRYHQARSRNAILLLAVLLLLIAFGLLAEFSSVEDVPRPSRPAW